MKSSPLLLLNSRRKSGDFTRLAVSCLSVRLFVCLSSTRTCRPLADWHGSATVLAAVSGHRAAEPSGPRVSQMSLSPPPREFMLAAGAYSWP